MQSVVTEQPAALPGTTWRYVRHPGVSFDPMVFDEQELQRRSLTAGHASAGRGNTCFFTLQGHSLVLRQYRRGGLVQHLSKDQYVYTGLEKTRAMQEFNVLADLHGQQFPAPVPYACRVHRHGLLYTASLVTHRLQGETLAERLSLAREPLSEAVWAAIGRCIGHLHSLGYWHADLNAHNIMLDSPDRVFIIDFDRARKRTLPPGKPGRGWCLGNIDRLERSLLKLSTSIQVYERGFEVLKGQWVERLCHRSS